MANPVNSADLREIRVDVLNTRRHTHGQVDYNSGKARIPKTSSRSNEFVYVNSAYAGSLSSVSENRSLEPPTTVIREQYWACSKWPYGQRFLAIAVGVLIGTVVGLAITVALRGIDNENGIGGYFRSRSPPD